MRVAVFSDVHGNLTAMRAVLLQIEREKPDLAFFAGDLSLIGARPADTLRLLAENPWVNPVYGNTDEDILNPPDIPDDATAERRAFLQFKVDSVNWVREQCNPSDIDFLRVMPFAHRVSPSSDSGDDLLVVHANPKDVNAFVAPPAELQEEKMGSVMFPQTEAERDELLSGITAGCIAYGHFHFPNLQRSGTTLLANTSSVSNPMDRDPRAKYGLLTWDRATGWTADIVRLEYDIRAEQLELERAKPPKWREISGMLEGEIWLG